MRLNLQKVLVLSPHTDDMEIGAGGTVRLLVDKGIHVRLLVFSDCKKSINQNEYPKDVLRRECRAAANHLGIQDHQILEFPVRDFPEHRQEILEIIYEERRDFNPDLVISSWPNDMHQDHRTIGREAFRAFMRNDTSVWFYPIPGTCPGFSPQIFIPLKAEDLLEKIEMLHMYRTQVKMRDYFTNEKIESQLSFYGTFISTRYAEAFEIGKEIFNHFSVI